MQAIFLWALGLLVAAALFFVAAVLGTVGGAAVGLAVGLLFPGTLSLVGTALFGAAVPAWQLGAALGFVGSFLSTSVSQASKS